MADAVNQYQVSIPYGILGSTPFGVADVVISVSTLQLTLSCPPVMNPAPTIAIGENFSQTFTPVQTPAAGVPLTFTLKRRFSKPIPTFLVKTPSANGSLQIDIAPIDSATDINLWGQLYFSVTNPGVGGGACTTDDFSFTVATACTVAPFLITRNSPGAVSQLTTTNIVVATS